LKGLKKREERLRGAGVRMITVSADSAEELERYRAENELPFMMLSDSEKKLIKQYDLLNESERDGIAVPAIIVIDRGGKVRYSSVQAKYLRILNRRLLRDMEGLGLS
jgi:peroxiredoxin